MLVLHGRAVELAEAEPMEPFQRVRHRRAGDAGASLPPADGIDAASLPKALEEELVAVQVLLGQEGTHLRPIPVKGQANRQH